MGLQRFPFSGFAGGWNTRDAPQEIEPNEAQDLLNVDLTTVGNLAQRAGRTQFTDGTWPGFVVGNMRPWYGPVPGSFPTIVLSSTGGDLRSVSTAGVTSANRGSTAGPIPEFEQMPDSAGQNWMWAIWGDATSGSGAKWDGTGAAFTTWANTPPKGRVCRVWKNRMCISASLIGGLTQRVWFSDIGNPESPAAQYGTNWVDIRGSDDDEDPVTNIIPFGDRLIVFKKRSVWAIFNSNPPWDNIRLSSTVGCADRFQAAVVGSKLYFFNRDGLWSMTEQGVIDEVTYKIRPSLLNRLNYSKIDQARLSSTPDGRVLLALPLDGSNTNNYVIEVIPDLNVKSNRSVEDAIVLHDYKCAAICRFRPGLNVKEVVMGAHTTAATGISQLFNGTSDLGAAITSRWFGGWRSLISEEPFERVRRVNVEMSGDVLVEVFKDFANAAAYSKQLSVAGGGVGLQRARPETRARYHALRFSNSQLNKSFSIYAVEMAIRGGKEH